MDLNDIWPIFALEITTPRLTLRPGRDEDPPGLAAEMRTGLLCFAFDELGAQWAESSAASWNIASLRVSEKLGYRRNGVTRVSRRADEPVDAQCVRLDADEFVRPEWSIGVTGAQRVLEQMGIANG